VPEAGARGGRSGFQEQSRKRASVCLTVPWRPVLPVLSSAPVHLSTPLLAAAPMPPFPRVPAHLSIAPAALAPACVLPCLPAVHLRLPVPVGRAFITESNRMHLVPFGVQNRTFGPYLAAINASLQQVIHAAAGCSMCAFTGRPCRLVCQPASSRSVFGQTWIDTDSLVPFSVWADMDRRRQPRPAQRLGTAGGRAWVHGFHGGR
jgi:hypothetical protein